MIDQRNAAFLKDLQKGDLFEYGGFTFMKVGIVSDFGEVDCIDMLSGQSMLLPSKTIVNYQEGKLVLK